MVRLKSAERIMAEQELVKGKVQRDVARRNPGSRLRAQSLNFKLHMQDAEHRRAVRQGI